MCEILSIRGHTTIYYICIFHPFVSTLVVYNYWPVIFEEGPATPVLRLLRIWGKICRASNVKALEPTENQADDVIFNHGTPCSERGSSLRQKKSPIKSIVSFSCLVTIHNWFIFETEVEPTWTSNDDLVLFHLIWDPMSFITIQNRCSSFKKTFIMMKLVWRHT